MKRLNVVKAVVSGGDREAELRWKQAAPDKIIIGYTVLDPTQVDLVLLRREHAAGRLQVIGEVAPQYEGFRPNDPRMEPYLRMLVEKRLHLVEEGPTVLRYLRGLVEFGSNQMVWPDRIEKTVEAIEQADFPRRFHSSPPYDDSRMVGYSELGVPSGNLN